MGRRNLFFCLLAFVLVFGVQTVLAETTSELIKRKLTYIAKEVDRQKGDMRCPYGSITGNVLEGNFGRGNDCSSLRGAINRSFGFCNKYGGDCEELFSIHIHNNTSSQVKIYLFHPKEEDFSNKNALWVWTWEPWYSNNLGIEGVLLFVSQDFYLKVESESGMHWDERTIVEYNCTQRNYQDGQNLKIVLIEAKE